MERWTENFEERLNCGNEDEEPDYNTREKNNSREQDEPSVKEVTRPVMPELRLLQYLASLIRITLSQVRVQNDVSRTCTTQSGLRQGDYLSTIFFNLALEKAYADDVDIITKSKGDMIHAFVSLEEAAKKIGLRIKPKKTNSYMLVGAKEEKQRPQQTLTIREHNIEGTLSVVYLGSEVTNNNDTFCEIKRRVCLTNKSKNVQKHIQKKKIIQENGEWRRRYNYELYQKYNKPDIVAAIKVRRLKWMKHVEKKTETEPVKQIARQVD
ncbi:hypothetical protein ILUMI_18263 [Ignelater luminosus]|uniref:Reverse transcriptase domain-containing protein n=1 Tax=Ignelater luminosus TaxID=2038154 RepID=A0A8K0G6Q9_IGNLU|nr:hypothetical protein ILUMI_18263 [Ignelater luminosus]